MTSLLTPRDDINTVPIHGVNILPSINLSTDNFAKYNRDNLLGLFGTSFYFPLVHYGSFVVLYLSTTGMIRNFNPGPAEPGYALSLQTVQIQ